MTEMVMKALHEAIAKSHKDALSVFVNLNPANGQICRFAMSLLKEKRLYLNQEEDSS